MKTSWKWPGWWLHSSVKVLNATNLALKIIKMVKMLFTIVKTKQNKKNPKEHKQLGPSWGTLPPGGISHPLGRWLLWTSSIWGRQGLPCLHCFCRHQHPCSRRISQNALARPLALHLIKELILQARKCSGGSMPTSPLWRVNWSELKSGLAYWRRCYGTQSTHRGSICFDSTIVQCCTLKPECMVPGIKGQKQNWFLSLLYLGTYMQNF